MAGSWCKKPSAAKAMPAQAQERELPNGPSPVLQSHAYTSAPSVSCLPLLHASILNLPTIGVPVLSQLSIILLPVVRPRRVLFCFSMLEQPLVYHCCRLTSAYVGQLAPSSFPMLLPILYMYFAPLYLLNIILPLCGMRGWSVYTDPLSVPGIITLLAEGEANSSMT